MKKNSLISVVIVLLACAFSVTTNNAQSSKCDSIGPRIVEVSLGYRMSEVGYVENLLPTLDVAFQVALPILKAAYETDFKGNMPFKGYLANDSVWVIYGSSPRTADGRYKEGGFPYIELNKRDARVIRMIHTK